MSSTLRGYERHKADYYVTPTKCIHDFFNQWVQDVNDEYHDNTIDIYNTDKVWLDPCAGGDSLHPMSYPKVIKEVFGADTITVDIRRSSRAQIIKDFLHMDKQDFDIPPSIVITNPPFHIAIEVIHKALEIVADNGYVIMLLRLNFFGSKARKSFFNSYLPVWTYVHHRRMSFTDNGTTDSIEYCHMVWQKGNYPDFTMLKVI